LSHLAEGLTDRTDSLGRGPGTNKGAAIPRRVAPSQGVSEEVETLLRHRADACLLVVERQLQRGHEGLHLLSRLGRMAATENDEVIRIDHQPRLQLLLPTPFLPPQDKPAQVEVAQQR